MLVVFLAGYLADNRALLAGASTRLGPLRLPPLPYLLPMLAMWGIALAIVVVQRDLGAALLFFSVFLAMLYIATRRRGYVVLGLAPVRRRRRSVLYALFPHVRMRVDIWLDPFADPLGAGFQVLRALYAFGRGGILGTGLGAGLPGVGRRAGDPGAPHRLRLRGAGARSWAWSARWPSSPCTWSSPSAGCASRRARATSSGRCWRPA